LEKWSVCGLAARKQTIFPNSVPLSTPKALGEEKRGWEILD
jgi:hypothetical protein